jgi:spore photoproduct lyase
MSIARVYIDSRVADDPETAAICSRLGLPVKTVGRAEEVYAEISAAPDPIRHGKQVLYLTRNQGAFIKDCPGTRHYTCCGYRILNVGTFCVMDCSYCILQAYFHPPVLQYFVNHSEMSAELQRCFAAPAVQRLGTGEFTDSLIWELWTPSCVRLIRMFAEQDHAVLELKTKTTATDRLLELAHNRKTILAWSLNTERIIRTEERGTASLDARLKTAALCAEHGYPVAFHFDPMMIYDGCEADYREAVERLFRAVDPQHIVWISMGSLRYMTDLKPIIQRRFPESTIPYGEFISGLDGKMRYFKPLRMKLFRELAAAIRRQAPGVCLYLCMEDEEVWRDALGFDPAERGGLKRMLDESAARHCGLNGSIL